jgi:hypothetical protein
MEGPLAQAAKVSDRPLCIGRNYAKLLILAALITAVFPASVSCKAGLRWT